MDSITIRDIKVFVITPRGINLVIVKAEASEPELFGYGCATFTQRHKAVITAIKEYLRPVLKDKSAHNIEDIWQTVMGSSYWRNGPILNNIVPGVDRTLQDIKGKLAGMSLYSLLGGKAREGMTVYRHTDGGCLEEIEECINQYIERGYRYIRCHMGAYGGNFDGKRQQMVKPEGVPESVYPYPEMYMDSVIRPFEQVRKDLGWELEAMHDVHEQFSLADALAFTKELEPFKLFFLEDFLAPDQVGYYKYLREQTAVPFAMREPFANPAEWKTIIQNQWIDFIGVHLSDVGGVTPVVKLAHFYDAYGVRTTWHGPNDLSPIGMCAQARLDLNSRNFGIQEFSGFTQKEEAIFPGCPGIRDGYARVDDAPDISVGFDEKEAAKYPAVDMDHNWLFARLPNGTAVRSQGGHCAADFYMVNCTDNRTQFWP